VVVVEFVVVVVVCSVHGRLHFQSRVWFLVVVVVVVVFVVFVVRSVCGSAALAKSCLVTGI